ncbi:MAG TPA: hypothetical protein VF888_02325 [Nitrospirota bacterium]
MNRISGVWPLSVKIPYHAVYRVVSCEEEVNARNQKSNEKPRGHEAPGSQGFGEEYSMRKEHRGKCETEDKIQKHEDKEENPDSPAFFSFYIDKRQGHGE